MSAPARPAPAPAAAPAAPTGYLHEVDVVRLLTFASVIGVHALSGTTSSSSVPAGVAAVLLHFTRETFFVLSAFVLFHVHYAKGLATVRFWRRRASTIVLPYVLWSAIYWATKLHTAPWQPAALLRLVHDLWSGEAKFHLYFLLVSMQLYLVLPLLIALVRRSRGHHRALLSAAVALQLGVLALYHWTRPSAGAAYQLHHYADTLLPTYVGYVLAGALAAVHLGRLRAWVVAHSRAVVALLAAGAALDLAVFAAGLAAGQGASHAAEPLQPVLVPWTAVVTLALFALGCRYAAARRAGGLPRLGRAVSTGSTISFGVFLVHPLVLQYAIPGLHLDDGTVPAPASTVLAWLLAASASTAAVLVVVRTPLSLALTGRHWQRRERGERHER